MRHWTITSLEELTAIAADLGHDLKELAAEQAVVLALYGDLGAGKTTFVQTLAKTLGISDTITSPTFVIMKRYPSQSLSLIHIDAYRVEHIDEMRVLGFEEWLHEKRTIICIEWADRISELLPPGTIHLKFEQNGPKRTITQS